MNRRSINQLCDTFHNNPLIYPPIEARILKPLSLISQSNTEYQTIELGYFICLIGKGVYVRTSGTFQYFVLSVQSSLSLPENDLKQLFKY